jgi:hypothetical protein
VPGPMLSGMREFTWRESQDPRLALAATPTPPWMGTTFSKDHSGELGAAMKLEGMLAVASLLVGSPSRTRLSTRSKQSLTMRW